MALASLRAGVAFAWACLCCVASPAAWSQPALAEISPLTVRDDVYPELHATFAGGIMGLPNVEYANLTGYRPLLLDVYTRADAGKGKALPLVVWIHGGGWERGDSRTSAAYANFPAVLASLAAKGYVVASVNYRLSGEARFPAAIQDVKSAIRFLKLNAAKYGIDPQRVILWGGSAGGHLAALAATSCGAGQFAAGPSTGRLSGSGARKLAASGPADDSDCVQAAVTWYAPFDLAQTDSATLARFLGCDPKKCPDAVKVASPINHVKRTAPPMLLIHGSADRTVAASQMALMAAQLRSQGAAVQTLLIPDVDHGWLGADANTTRQASLLALQRSFEFFDAYVASSGAGR